MKKNGIILILLLFLGLIGNVKAATYSIDKIPNSTYVIGKYMFTRNENEATGYNGILTTRRIMIASKTVAGDSQDDMIIYYKTNRGVLINALTKETITDIEEFEIINIDLEKIAYMVTFDSDGGTEVETQLVAENETAIEPSIPLKTGYTFKEWQLNGEKYEFTEPVTEHITLKAVYDINEYTVTFISFGNMSTQKVLYNETVEEIAATEQVGHTFIEWQLNGERYDFSSPVVSDITLYAAYEINKYKVTFDSAGGSVISAQFVDYNSVAIKPNDPTKTGYTFKEWQLNGEKYEFTEPVTSAITLVAVYDINKYTVTFNSAGGSSVSAQTVDYNGTATKPEDPTRLSYDFKFWSLNGTNEYNFNTLITRNITLIAVWEEKTYTIRAIPLDAITTAHELKVYLNGEEIAFLEINADGYLICDSTNNTANLYDFAGIEVFDVTLMDGTIVTATLEEGQ